MEILKRSDPHSFFIKQSICSVITDMLFGDDPRIDGNKVTVLQIAMINDHTIIFEVVIKHVRRIEMSADELSAFTKKKTD
jgi:hypothetical protein